MGNSYEIVIHLDVKDDALKIIQEMHTRFCAYGFDDKKYKEMILSDHEEEDDNDWEPVDDLHQAFERIAEHPALGGVIYSIEAYTLVVGYRRQTKADSVQCISIAFDDFWIKHELTRQAIKRLLALVVEAHLTYKALRTIWQWELEAAHSNYWQEERQRLFGHQITGLYWLDILREEFVTPERIDFLSQNLTVESVLERLDDGSLYYQRSGSPEDWYVVPKVNAK